MSSRAAESTEQRLAWMNCEVKARELDCDALHRRTSQNMDQILGSHIRGLTSNAECTEHVLALMAHVEFELNQLRCEEKIASERVSRFPFPLGIINFHADPGHRVGSALPQLPAIMSLARQRRTTRPWQQESQLPLHPRATILSPRFQRCQHPALRKSH